MADGHTVNVHQVDRVPAPGGPLVPVVVGANTNDQDAADLILTGSRDRPRITRYALYVGMAGMLMADSHDLR